MRSAARRTLASTLVGLLVAAAAVFGIATPAQAATGTLGELTNGQTITPRLLDFDEAPYQVLSGALPGGLALSTAGLLTGTVDTAATSYAFSVHSFNGRFIDFTGSIVQPVTWTGSDPTFRVALAANVQLAATAATNYAVQSGELPAGLTLGSTGQITGTPTTAGPFSFTVRASNSTAFTDRTFSGTVNPIPTWTGPTTFLLTAGEEFTLPFSSHITDGHGTWVSLTIPSLTWIVNDSEKFVFTIAEPGTYGMRIAAANAFTIGDQEIWLPITLEVRGLPAWQTAALGALAYDTAASVQLDATHAIEYSVTGGALPAGLNLGLDGLLAGTPTAFGPYSFTVAATNGVTAVERTFTGTVAAPLATWTSTALPLLHKGVAVDEQLVADNAESFAVTDGDLPDGLTLDPDGRLTGTPTAAGTFEFEVTAANPDDIGAARSFTVVVDQAELSIDFGGTVGGAAAGASVDVDGSGLAVDAAYSLVLHSDPVTIASGAADATGVLSLSSVLPASVPFGAHSLTLTTTAADGSTVTSAIWFSVGVDGRIVEISTTGPVATPALPAAATVAGIPALGADVLPWAVAAAVLLLVGGIAFALSRRGKAGRKAE